MKRMSLFEFEDFPWFPNRLREYLTNYLRSLHRLMKTDEVIAPLLEKCLRKTNETAIVDLCSGAGGPVESAVQKASAKLGLPVRVTLTDLYPNQKAIERIEHLKDPNVEYLSTPIDAARVPKELVGLRTMVCSFHHMPPDVAASILKDTVSQRRAICIFEISDNSQPYGTWVIAIPIGFILTLLMTPFVRPISLGHLFFTYVIPIMPIVIAWDGAASNARTYTKTDLQELIQSADLNGADYEWEIESVSKAGVPGRMLYLLGFPTGDKNEIENS